MNPNRVITYSLLAHIHNSSKKEQGLLDVFVPLIKRVLIEFKDSGKNGGKNISELKEVADIKYSINFPIPVLKNVLIKICNEVNTSEKLNLVIHSDNSFSIGDIYFSEFTDLYTNSKNDVQELQAHFNEFLKIHEINTESISILDFIEKNKLSLARYLTSSPVVFSPEKFEIEAKFIEFFRGIPKIYELIKDLYLGSIISSYLEYKTEELKTDIQLLFDTNFIISLLDLNTPQSTHTCQMLVDICIKSGFKLFVLKDTIEEMQRLLLGKASNFDNAFLLKKINPEDIYNACERRNLKKVDIERISDNLERLIQEKGIAIIYETSKYVNQAKVSTEYQNLLKVRNNELAALHDATAIIYVRDKRGKKIKEFENVNCWFVNNSISETTYRDEKNNPYYNQFEYQPETIKADVLLNILWLSNPNIKINLDGDELANIGIATLLSFTLNQSLPKSSVIRELDENIRKYANEKISDIDILRVATRIANKQLKNIDELNRIAESNEEEFISRLNKEAQIQKEKEENVSKKLNDVLFKLEENTTKLNSVRVEYDKRIQDSLEKDETIKAKLDSNISKIGNLERDLEIERQSKINSNNLLLEEKRKRLLTENSTRKHKKAEFIETNVKKWQMTCWYCLFVYGVIFLILFTYFLSKCDWHIVSTINYLISNESDILIKGFWAIFGFVATYFLAKLFYDRFFDSTKKNGFIATLEIPKEFFELKDIEDLPN